MKARLTILSSTHDTPSFEHSLVQELGYTGYERLRKAFDRAFDQKPPVFGKVLDAGCGTGLVGEQVRKLRRLSVNYYSIILLLTFMDVPVPKCQ